LLMSQLRLGMQEYVVHNAREDGEESFGEQTRRNSHLSLETRGRRHETEQRNAAPPPPLQIGSLASERYASASHTARQLSGNCRWESRRSCSPSMAARLAAKDQFPVLHAKIEGAPLAASVQSHIHCAPSLVPKAMVHSSQACVVRGPSETWPVPLQEQATTTVAEAAVRLSFDRKMTPSGHRPEISLHGHADAGAALLTELAESISAKLIREEVARCSTAEAIMATCDVKLTQFSVLGTLDTLRALADMQDNFKVRREPSFVQLLGRTADILDQYRLEARDVVGTSWAVARLGLQSRSLLDAVASAARRTLPTFNATRIACLAWACAILVMNSSDLMSALSAQVIRIASDLPIQALSLTIWSYAKLAMRHGQAMHWMASASMANMSEAPAEALANTAWACAKMHYVHEKLIESVSVRSISIITEFRGQQLWNLAWSFAELFYCDYSFLQNFVLQSLAKQSEFGPDTLSNVAWALAVCGFHAPPLLDAISSRAIALAPDFSSAALAGIAWAFAAQAHLDRPLFCAVSAQSLVRIEDFSSESMGNTAWALGHLLLANEQPLLSAIATAARKQHDRLNAVDTAGISWAMAKRHCSWPAIDIVTNLGR